MGIKQTIKKIVPSGVFIKVTKALYPEKINVVEDRLASFFLAQHQNVASPDLDQKIALRNAEFKVYSKHGGDGILLYIFSKIGKTNCRFVEMGVEQGTECNTAILSLNLGWKGLLIDANEVWIASARNFYKEKLGAKAENVKMAVSFVTAENINQTIKGNGFGGEIDLLSIDIDSNDYFVWDKINVINPRVVIMEYNAAFGFHSVTMKYDPQFHFQNVYRTNPLYFGVSLTALTKLAHKKGYVLVACDTHGHDAYFVRKDVASGKFTDQTPEQAFYPNPVTISRFGSLEKQWEMVKNLPFEEVK